MKPTSSVAQPLDMSVIMLPTIPVHIQLALRRADTRPQPVVVPAGQLVDEGYDADDEDEDELVEAENRRQRQIELLLAHVETALATDTPNLDVVFFPSPPPESPTHYDNWQVNLYSSKYGAGGIPLYEMVSSSQRPGSSSSGMSTSSSFYNTTSPSSGSLLELRRGSSSSGVSFSSMLSSASSQYPLRPAVFRAPEAPQDVPAPAPSYRFPPATSDSALASDEEDDNVAVREELD